MPPADPLPQAAAEPGPHDPEWYLEFAADLVARFAAGPPPVDEQRQAIATLYERFRRNYADNDKRALSPDQLDRFLAHTAVFAGLLDGEALATRMARIPEHFRRHLLLCRGEPSRPAGIEIKSIMSLDGGLLLHGFVDDPSFGPADRITLRQSGPGAGRHHAIDDAGLRQSYRYFGRTLVDYRAFDLRLPLAGLSPGTELSWQLSTQPGPAPLRFSTGAARLAPDLGVDYVRLGELALRARPAAIAIVRPTRRAALTAELRALAGLRGAKLPTRRKAAKLALRLAYLLTRPAFRRPSVLYFDKLYLGGDNGQHLFEYAAAQARSTGARTRHRYVIHHRAAAFEELRSRGLPVVDFGSRWCKLHALNADLVAGTHANVFSYLRLDSFDRRWFAAVLGAHVVCIQHGLTVQHIPHLQARGVDNTERYFCASPIEVANLSRPEYCYSPDMLRLTGLARYDGLVPATEKLVLIAPTWRRYVANDVTRMGRPRGYTATFADSPFHAVYRQVLTDPALLDGLRERGHRLRFLLHPTLTAQVADFTSLVEEQPLMAGVVEVVTATEQGYTPHLRAGAVLVTDYSGIQFDFAHQGKPLIYFHPPELPPSYPLGDFDPARHGFGPVVDGLAGLREQVLASIDAGARPTAEFARRIDDFFAYRDHGNSARIHAELRAEYGLD